MFDEGHAVGELAKQLYPDGIEVDWNVGFDKVTKTWKLPTATPPIWNTCESLSATSTISNANASAPPSSTTAPKTPLP